MAQIIPSARTKLGTSHGGRWSYWKDSKDLYVYQMDEWSGDWIGWYSALSVWETTMHRIMES